MIIKQKKYGVNGDVFVVLQYVGNRTSTKSIQGKAIKRSGLSLTDFISKEYGTDKLI